MQYQEFVCAVEKKMNKKMEGGMKASLHKTVKNNGTERTGLMIETPGKNIFPTIYLEEFYERFQKGEMIDAVIDDILECYQDAESETPTGVYMLEHFEQIREKIVFKLINTKQNEKQLRELPNLPFLDLSIVFYVLLNVRDRGTATMLIKNEHLRMWNVGKTDIYEAAGENMIRLLPAELYTVKQTVEEIMHPSGQKKRQNLLKEKEENQVLDDQKISVEEEQQIPVEEEQDFMYVLSNHLRSFGAACILYPHVLEMVGDVIGEDFYVLPSSVHEVIVVPESYSMEQGEMEAMVTEINETQVAAEEVLSNHAYFYERKTGKLALSK